MRQPRCVVVGVDDTNSGDDALDWATAEAAARGVPLRIVHAHLPVASWAGLGDVPQPFLHAEECAAAARDVLAGAVTRARSVASDVDIRGRLVSGAGAPALLAQCAEAELLVLGSRGLGALRGLVSGSVSLRVATHATCPVVVIRPMRPTTPGRSATRVVVGVDGTKLSEPAVEFAVHAAAQRGVGVTAIHAWSPRTPADDRPPAQWHHLQHTLRRCPPGTDVELRLVRGRPQDVLAAESAGAALVVVGSRGRGSVRAALQGSVSQAVLQHAGCPVAVVR